MNHSTDPLVDDRFLEAHGIRLKVRPDLTGRASFHVSALTRSGRILAVIHVDVSLEPGYPLDERVGRSGVDAIVERAKDLALAAGRAVSTDPVRSRAAG